MLLESDAYVVNLVVAKPFANSTQFYRAMDGMACSAGRLFNPIHVRYVQDVDKEHKNWTIERAAHVRDQRIEGYKEVLRRREEKERAKHKAYRGRVDRIQKTKSTVRLTV